MAGGRYDLQETGQVGILLTAYTVKTVAEGVLSRDKRPIRRRLDGQIIIGRAVCEGVAWPDEREAGA